MATRYVTLKDSNGDTIYPQSVISQVANGEITTGLIADGAVTSAKIANGTIATADIANSAVTAAKIAPSVLEFQPGDTLPCVNTNYFWTARQRKNSTTNAIEVTFILPKPVATTVSSITFSPSGYNEAFSSTGWLFSWNNPTSSQLTTSIGWSQNMRHALRVNVNVADSSVTLTNNQPCIVQLSGTFTFS